MGEGERGREQGTEGKGGREGRRRREGGERERNKVREGERKKESKRGRGKRGNGEEIEGWWEGRQRRRKLFYKESNKSHEKLDYSSVYEYIL